MKKLKPESIIATFFGIGKFPYAPGTLGSLAAIILVALLFYQPHMVQLDGKSYVNMGAVLLNPKYIIYVLIIASLIIHVIGVWAADKYSKLIEVKDPGCVVIDEVAGIFTASTLVALIYAGLLYFDEKNYLLYLIISYWFFPIIFILFRFFDIIKPWHVGWADKKLDGGFGIMIDDQIAGVYSAITFYIIFFALKYFRILDSLITIK